MQREICSMPGAPALLETVLGRLQRDGKVALNCSKGHHRQNGQSLAFCLYLFINVMRLCVYLLSMFYCCMRLAFAIHCARFACCYTFDVFRVRFVFL